MTIHHVALICSSEKSIEFYNRLGFEVYFRKERSYDTIVLMKGQGVKLEIFIDPNHPHRATEPEALGLRHLALKVDDLDKAREE